MEEFDLEDVMKREVLGQDFDIETSVVHITLKRFDSVTGEDAEPMRLSCNIHELNDRKDSNNRTIDKLNAENSNIEAFITRFVSSEAEETSDGSILH